MLTLLIHLGLFVVITLGQCTEYCRTCSCNEIISTCPETYSAGYGMAIYSFPCTYCNVTFEFTGDNDLIAAYVMTLNEYNAYLNGQQSYSLYIVPERGCDRQTFLSDLPSEEYAVLILCANDFASCQLTYDVFYSNRTMPTPTPTAETSTSGSSTSELSTMGSSTMDSLTSTSESSTMDSSTPETTSNEGQIIAMWWLLITT